MIAEKHNLFFFVSFLLVCDGDVSCGAVQFSAESGAV